jgi:hypothetical protein
MILLGQTMWALLLWAGPGQADRKSPVNFDAKICVDTEDDETYIGETVVETLVLIR